MNILDKIVTYKYQEVAEQKLKRSVNQLEQSDFFHREVISLKKRITEENSSGIIAEFKRKSPSKGIINDKVSVKHVTEGYVKAGASCLSILTDKEFFGGSNSDLRAAREVNCPILRKDFVVDEYQIVEAKSIGADVILLIAAVLNPITVKAYTVLAHSLNLEVLLEVHNEEELQQNQESGADLIGVNNRNLKTFEVNTDVSKRLATLMPKEVIKVSESGIDNVSTIRELKEFGFKGFLMGQAFMEQQDPGQACKKFIDELKKKA